MRNYHCGCICHCPHIVVGPDEPELGTPDVLCYSCWSRYDSKDPCHRPKTAENQ